MSTNDKKNKTTRRDRLRILRNGIQLHLLPLKTVTIGGTVHQVADILAGIDADIATSDTAEKDHASWLQSVSVERASHKALDPILSGVKQWVRLNIGDTEAQQAVLADFGMTPRKVTKAAPKTLVAAHTKALATRKLLNTQGAVQKKAAKAAAAPAQGGTTTTAAAAAGGASTPAKS